VILPAPDLSSSKLVSRLTTTFGMLSLSHGRQWNGIGVTVIVVVARETSVDCKASVDGA